jgi:predicted nuclease of restriction endonuclease-like (RecB) superfamily
LLALYWQLGRDILERQRRHGWGARIVDKVATDLRAAFPAMKGFSRANLMYMRAGFAEAWPEADFVQGPVGQLPWGHNLVLLSKLKEPGARLAYAARALEHGWSHAVLVHHLEARTVERQGKALTNFAERLPRPQSDLARESLKGSVSLRLPRYRRRSKRSRARGGARPAHHPLPARMPSHEHRNCPRSSHARVRPERNGRKIGFWHRRQ